MRPEMKLIGITAIAAATFVATSVTRAAAPQPPAPPSTPASTQPSSGGRSTSLPPDANGNTMRVATRTGHISNYDESKMPAYTLPDPLTLANGRKVTTADAWTRQRRPEIVKLYESVIFGHVPANAPKVTWNVTETDPGARDGSALMKKIVGTAGTGPNAPTIRVTEYTPAKATGRVPIILELAFGGGPATGRGSAVADPPIAAEILARGWGFRDGRLSGHPARSRGRLQRRRDRSVTQARTDRSGRRRMGRGVGVGVGREPRHRLSRDRSQRRCASDRAPGIFAARQGGALGDRHGSAHRRALVRMRGRDGFRVVSPRLGRDRGRHGAEFPLAVRRAAFSSGLDIGTTCRSTRTCSSR